jgi:CBS-domain-containing membrane protein
VHEDASYREIVDVLETRAVSAVPVVDDSRRVVGVISESDLLSKVRYAGSSHEPPLFERREHRQAREQAAATTARGLMSAPAVTVLAGTSVVWAARLMAEVKVKRMPVVDDLGRLIGMVTGRDLLKVFLRGDDEIRADVRESLFARFGALLDVEVADGTVTLSGEVTRRSEIPVAVTVAERVDGVVAVTERLTHVRDDTLPEYTGPLARY